MLFSKKIIIVLLLLLIGSVGGFFVVKKYSTPFDSSGSGAVNSIQQTFSSLLSSVQKTAEKDSELFNTAIKNQNTKGCEAIKDAAMKDDCMDQIRINEIKKTEKISDCTTLTNTERVKLCKDIVAESTALSTLNASICEYIQDATTKKRCLENIDAKKYENIIATKSYSEATCSELSGTFKSECLKMISTVDAEEAYYRAIKSGKIELCSLVTNERLYQNCRDTILGDVAIAQNSENFCMSILDQEKKNSCFARLAITRNNTLFENAVNTNNLQACESIADTEIRNRCHDIVVLSLVKITKNPSLCDMLTSISNRENCKRIDTNK